MSSDLIPTVSLVVSIIVLPVGGFLVGGWGGALCGLGFVGLTVWHGARVGG